MKTEANTIDEYYDLLQEVEGLDVQIVQVRKDYRVLQVNTPDPKAMRRELVRVIGPKLGIDFLAPRKTKKDGYTLEIPTYLDDEEEDEGEPIVVRIKKGGSHRAGRKNEEDFQKFILDEIERNGVCHLDISDNYGVRVKLDIVEVIDASASHGTNGEQNRSDTTVRLTDGTLYGISHKKTNATYVCKARKMFHEIMFQCGQKLRQYAKEHWMQRGDYMDVRITNKDLIDLCWFGTDISTGAVFIGDFENMSSGEQHIERIIRNGDDDVLTSFPIYTKWLIVNNTYTMKFCGVSVASKGGKWIVDDVEVPGVNAPMPIGKRFVTGQADERPTRRRKSRRRLLRESSLDDMWDTIAWCAENRKMVWLKYETVDGETISRRVAPYSYRTRRTKIRGKATYFYGQDFTPGEDHTIKCFLVDNCLDAKKSPSSFFPKFNVEIKQEIDRLEQKRIDDEQREKEEKAKQEQAQKEKAKNVGHEIKAKQKTKKDIEQSKQIPKKEDPNKPKKVEVVKGKEEQEVEKPEKTPEDEVVKVGAVNIDSNDKGGDDKPDENSVTVTDDDGNEI